MKTFTLEVTDEELHALAYHSQHVAGRPADGSEAETLEALATRALSLCAENDIDPHKPFSREMTLEEARARVEAEMGGWMTDSLDEVALRILLDATASMSTQPAEPEPEPEQEIEVGDWVRNENGAYCEVTSVNSDRVWGYNTHPYMKLNNIRAHCTLIRKAGVLKVGDEFERIQDRSCGKWPARKRGTIVGFDVGCPLTSDGTWHEPACIRLVTPVEVRKP